jgi:hypothetical protein
MLRKGMSAGFWWGKTKEKRPLGCYRRRWEDNIKIYLRQIGWSGMESVHLAQDRNQWQALVNTVTNLCIP